jgi:hypothetical protein
VLNTAPDGNDPGNAGAAEAGALIIIVAITSMKIVAGVATTIENRRALTAATLVLRFIQLPCSFATPRATT